MAGDGWRRYYHSHLALHGHDDLVNTVAIAPDGSTLASGSDDGSVRLWSLSDTPIDQALFDPAIAPTVLGEDLFRIHSVTFSPNGQCR